MSHNYSAIPALISIGGSASQVLLIERMRELGYAVIVVDRNPEARGFKCSDIKLYLSTHEAVPIITELNKFKNKYDLMGVFTRSSGTPVITTAIVADYFDLPGATEKAASNIVNKSSLMNLCQLNGIVTPRSQMINGDYFSAIANRIPCVLKPAFTLVGKKGIKLVRKENEIVPAYHAAKSASPNGEVLLENYVTGVDVILMSVVAGGQVFPVTLVRELNEFDSNGDLSAKGVSMPYYKDKIEAQSIYELAQAIVDISGLQYGPFLMSCRCSTDSVPVPIEMHLDFGGDGILDELFPMSTDFDFIKYVLKVMLNMREPELLGEAHFNYSELYK